MESVMRGHSLARPLVHSSAKGGDVPAGLPSPNAKSRNSHPGGQGVSHMPLGLGLAKVVNEERGMSSLQQPPQQLPPLGIPLGAAYRAEHEALLRDERTAATLDAALAASDLSILASKRASLQMEHMRQLERVAQTERLLQAHTAASVMAASRAVPPPQPAVPSSLTMAEALYWRQQRQMALDLSTLSLPRQTAGLGLAGLSAGSRFAGLPPQISKELLLAQAAAEQLDLKRSFPGVLPDHKNDVSPRQQKKLKVQGGISSELNFKRSAPASLPDMRSSPGTSSSKKVSSATASKPSPSGDTDDDDILHRFRPYQYEQWTEKFQQLCDYRKLHGHCQVPHTFNEAPALARWVKRQRYQFKLKSEKKQSTMTDERIKLLEDIGFIWDSHAAAWAEKLHELKEYSRVNGNCNVPSTYPVNPQLATWVKCQRRQFKLLKENKKSSNMTPDRMLLLEKIGFVWEVRKQWDPTKLDKPAPSSSTHV